MNKLLQVEEKLEEQNFLEKNFIVSFFYLPSFAAICEGNGGQQKRQHRSRIDNVFIIHSSKTLKKQIIIEL